jgi:hypothetical protein
MRASKMVNVYRSDVHISYKEVLNILTELKIYSCKIKYLNTIIASISIR